VFISAILAGFFAGFSPFWGLLIIVAYSYRYFQERNLKYAVSFFAAALLSVIFVNGQQIALSLFDAYFGVGLVAFIFFKILADKRDLSQSLLYSSGVAAIYGILRQILFHQVLIEQMQQNSVMTTELSQELFSDNPEMLQLAMQSVESSVQIFTSYGVAIWFLVIISSLFAGIAWLTFKEKGIGVISAIKLPYGFVYPLIASMLLFLIPGLRVTGINVLLIVIPLFLIQGIAVNAYFLKHVMKGKNMIWVTVLLIIFLNYLYLIFLVFLGIADLWLQYRERYQKRIKSKLDE